MIRLVINGRDADVLQTETIVGEYAIAPIGDISKRVGARSIQFKLPKTATNKAIFESSEIPTSTSKIPYRNLPCRIYVDGVDMNMQFCQLENVNEFYNIRLYGSNSDIFRELKNKKLSDLDLNHLNHHWSVNHIAVSKAKDYPLKYALIDYNSDSPNYSIDESDSSIYIGCLYPVVYQHYLINKIFNENGYAVNNETEQSLVFQKRTLVTPLASGGYKRDYNPHKYIGKFVGNTVFADTLTVDVVSQLEVMYNEVDSTVIKFQDELRVKIRGNIRARVTVIDPIFLVTQLKIDLKYSNTSVMGYKDATIADVLLSDMIFHDFHFDLEVIVDKNYGAFNLPSIIPATFTSAGYEVDAPACYFEIYEVEVLNALPLRYDIIADNPYNDYVTVANNLPLWTQADFIKQYLISTNSVFTIDERSKVVTICPFKKIKENLSNSLDWSNKLDFTNSTKTEFKLDYAQHNYLKYADDKDIIKPIGTDYDMSIDDQRLDYEKTLIQLMYSASESVYRCNKFMAKINSFQDYLSVNAFTPRNLFIRYEDFTFRYRPNKTDAIDAVTITTDVPIGYFIDVNEEYNLGFENNLFSIFFLFITGVIDYAKIIECEMRLTTLDIANFEPLKPVYIREFDAHFYVNKIKFEYTSRKSSVVELIKLL